MGVSISGFHGNEVRVLVSSFQPGLSTKSGRIGVGEPTRASHILGKGMSATTPLQNTLNDVIGVWSDSRKVVGCSVSLVAAPCLAYTMGTGGSNGQ